MQNIFLLLGSYLFYACWDWRFLFLILIPTTVDFFCARAIYRARNRLKKIVFLWCAIAVDLVILFFFKYFNFFIDNLSAILRAIGIGNLSSFHLNIILPLGISYYLFKSISYIIDVYREVIKEPAKNILHYALYLSFFPQILAGPIERAVNFLPQLSRPRVFQIKYFSNSLYLIFWGLFKKMFVADNLAALIESLSLPIISPSGFDILLGAYLATFKIYADFSGYSDMAIGIAGCLGFTTMPNFNLPFFAKNPADIWRRWHISLSSWCRDYVYYYVNRLMMWLKIGGRKGSAIAAVITMCAMGLWHQASWPFIFWGIYHGTLLSMQIFVRWLLVKFRYVKKPRSNFLLTLFKIFFTFHLFALGIQIRTVASGRELLSFLHSVFSQFEVSRLSLALLGGTAFYISILILLETVQYTHNDEFIVRKLNPWLKGFIYFILLLMLVSGGMRGGRSFVYMQY
jgi:D-alanyl-lipoteichoic acid acyltransferase DltB (MBOAT superfamily)